LTGGSANFELGPPIKRGYRKIWGKAEGYASFKDGKKTVQRSEHTSGITVTEMRGKSRTMRGVGAGGVRKMYKFRE